MKKSIIAGIVFSIFLTFNAEASLISFYIVETGLPEDAGVNRFSVLWENAFMDSFFDSGYIVTNYPTLRFNSKPEGNIHEISGFDVYEAREAGVDYILITKLDYSSPVQEPELISFYLFKVDQHEIIYEKQIDGKKYASDRDASLDLKNIIKELVQFVVNL